MKYQCEKCGQMFETKRITKCPSCRQRIKAKTLNNDLLIIKKTHNGIIKRQLLIILAAFSCFLLSYLVYISKLRFPEQTKTALITLPIIVGFIYLWKAGKAIIKEMISFRRKK